MIEGRMVQTEFRMLLVGESSRIWDVAKAGFTDQIDGAMVDVWPIEFLRQILAEFLRRYHPQLTALNATMAFVHLNWTRWVSSG